MKFASNPNLEELSALIAEYIGKSPQFEGDLELAGKIGAKLVDVAFDLMRTNNG